MTSCQRRSHHGQVIFLVSIKDPLRSLIHALVWSRIAGVVFAPTIEQESMTSWNVQLHVFHLTQRHFPDCQRCCGPPYQSSSSSVIIILLILILFPHPHKTGQVSMCTWDYFNTGRILFVFTWRYILGTFQPALYIYTYAYIYIYMFIYICMYVYMYIYVYICIYVYIYICVYIYVYVYVYIYVYVFIYMYINIYIYTYTYV
jgi:hypothetical protein